VARDVELSYLSHPGKKLTKHLRRIEAFADDEAFCRVVRYHDVGKCLESFQRYIRHEVAHAEPHAKISAVAYLLSNELSCEKAQKVFWGYCAVLCHHTALKSKATLCDDLFNAFEDYKWREVERQYNELYEKADVRRFWALRAWDVEALEKWADRFDYLKGDIEGYVAFKLLHSRLLFADKYEAAFSQSPQNKPFGLSLASLEAYKRAKGFDPASFPRRFAPRRPSASSKTTVALPKKLCVSPRPRAWAKRWRHWSWHWRLPIIKRCIASSMPFLLPVL